MFEVDDGESWKREKALPVRALFVLHLLPPNYGSSCSVCGQGFRDGQPMMIMPGYCGRHAIRCLPCHRRAEKRAGK